MDPTTTTDSLGIVTLATAAFKRGQLTREQVQAINDCADSFTHVLILAKKYREVTRESLPLDDVPSPVALRRLIESGDYAGALKEADSVKGRMDSLFQAVERKLGKA